jgi:hypothetical protein
VAPIVEDALSLTEKLVLRVITNIKMGARKQSGADGSERGFLCDPGGYDRIAKNAGICRKTAYNVVKSLIRKGALRVFEIKERGGQRVKTLYFAPHYSDVLAAWRNDETIFKTIRGAVVVRGRAKNIQTVENAIEWKIDPKRAPKRGCGRGRNPGEDDQEPLFEQEQSAAIPPAAPIPKPAPAGTDEELAMVLAGFQSISRACLQDAFDLVAAARVQQFPWAVTPAFILAALQGVVRTYTRTEQYPQPTPKWCIGRIAGSVAYGMSRRREAFVRTPVGALARGDLIEFLADALEMLDSGRASPEETNFCEAWIRRVEETAPEAIAEARGRGSAPEPRRMAG